MSGYFGVPAAAAAYSMVPQAAYSTPAVPGVMPTVQSALPTVQAYAPAAGMMTPTPYPASPAPAVYQAPVVGPAAPQYQPVNPVAAYQMPTGQVYTAPPVVNAQMQHAWQQQQQQAIVTPNYQQPQMQPQIQQRGQAYSADNSIAQQPRQKAPITTRLGVTGVNLNNLTPLGTQPEEQPKQQKQQQQQQQPAQRQQQQQQFQQRATSRLGVRPNIAGNAGNKQQQQQVFNKQQQQPSQYKHQQQQQQPFKRSSFPSRPFNSPTVASGQSQRGVRQPFRPGERRPFGPGPASQQQHQHQHGRKQQHPVGNDNDELIDAPPIGYEYIEELRVPDSHNRGGLNRFTVQYRCKLCDCRFTDPQAKEMHVKGRRHRMQFKRKVDPNLEVDAKPSAKARRAQEEKQRQPTADWIKRQEAPIPEMHAMEMSNYIGMRATSGVCSPGRSAGKHRIESNDDRHAIAKHSSVYPTEDELRSVQSLVSRCERALKLVSDSLTDEYDGSVLKGVMRVGVLAKGLLLHGDLATNLVLLCADAPTESLLKRIYQLIPARLNGETGEGEDGEEENKTEELNKKEEEIKEAAKNGDKKDEEMEIRDKKDGELEREKDDKEVNEGDKKNEVVDNDRKDKEIEDGGKKDEEMKDGDKKDEEMKDEDKKDEKIKEGDKKDKEMEKGDKKDEEMKDGDKKDEQMKEGDKKDEEMKEGDRKDEKMEEVDKKNEEMKDGDKKNEEMKDGDKKDEEMKEGDKKDEEMEEADKKDEEMEEGDQKDKDMEKGEKKDEEIKEGDTKNEEMKEGGEEDNDMEKGDQGEKMKDIDDKTREKEAQMNEDNKRGQEIKEEGNCDEEIKCEGKKDQEIIEGDKKEEISELDKKEDDSENANANVKKSSPPLITKLDEEESAIIIECPISEATCTVTLTSPVVREPQTDDKPEPSDALDKEKCLEALASVRHAKWFQAKASGMSTCLIVTRLLRDLCQRVPTWSPFPEWAMELIVERCASSCRAEFPSPGDCIRRVFECLAAGLILPGGPGVRDPCEKEPIDACAALTVQEREDITASAQHALRLIAFRQLHKVLDMDRLQPIGVKRKAEQSDGVEAAKKIARN